MSHTNANVYIGMFQANVYFILKHSLQNCISPRMEADIVLTDGVTAAPPQNAETEMTDDRESVVQVSSMHSPGKLTQNSSSVVNREAVAHGTKAFQVNTANVLF